MSIRIVAFLCLIVLSGCGFKGPLYMPQTEMQQQRQHKGEVNLNESIAKTNDKTLIGANSIESTINKADKPEN